MVTVRTISCAVLAFTLSACTIPVEKVEETPASTVVVTKAEVPREVPSKSPLDISDILARHGGQAGIALVDAKGTVTAGSLQEDVAWSTIKVPVVLAAERQGAAEAAKVSAVIRLSDNAAAQELWDSLGDGAAEKVEREIALIAQPPQVQDRVSRPGFTAFGQTKWQLSDQAMFGYRLQCHDLADSVVPLMADISNGGGYGLGTVADSYFKGGWGPDEQGRYLVRQFGFVQTPRGTVGVALAAKAAAGTYEANQVLLDELAQRATQYIYGQGLGSAAC